jgi:hypothetical protein
MKKLFKLTVLSLLAIVFLASCNQSGKKGANETSTDKLSQEEINEGIKEVLFPLPEPMGVYKMLENIGASYIGNILNPVESIEKYFASNVKATNLGVYTADLAYATVYDKKDAIDSYSKSMKVLIDDLGIRVDYKNLLSDETKQMANNVDSLIKITTKVFYDTYEFLYEESDPALAALMVNGFYIEGLYIATHISKDTYNNVEMVKIIYSQAKPLEKLIELNNKFMDNQYIETLQNALTKLKLQYDSSDGSLTKEQLDTITNIIETIRESLVS